MVQVKCKTKWAAPLQDLPVYFQRDDSDNIQEQQSIHTVHQLYGYMLFNDNKYGVPSNMKYAWFFQHIETADYKGRTLQYYGLINIDVDSVSTPNILKADHPLANTLVDLTQLSMTETSPSYRHSLTTQLQWLDHIQSFHLILTFAISSTILCAILLNEVVP
jgi:hypothetical protein